MGFQTSRGVNGFGAVRAFGDDLDSKSCPANCSFTTAAVSVCPTVSWMSSANLERSEVTAPAISRLPRRCLPVNTRTAPMMGMGGAPG